MKFIVCAFVLCVVVGATPDAPFRQTYNSRFLRLEAAPYAPAGYRPQGEQFRLPARPLFQRQQSVYGPPEVATEEVTTETDVTTTEVPTTTEYIPRRVVRTKSAKKDNVKVENKQDNAEAGIGQEFQQEGVYYIYHPDGLLQRVIYATKSEDMGYTAKLTYKDVEPIKEPIYTYDPQSLKFSQIQL
ncbi:uncharacterized protein [Atheta coriaria]|uniref:uncharacterized protein n=1 Tax=Dalotia coriaria TaxID=877792 RepID=UPI0031F3F91D